MLVPFKGRGKEGNSFMTKGDLKQLDDSVGKPTWRVLMNFILLLSML